jgi:hypothetical protein
LWQIRALQPGPYAVLGELQGHLEVTLTIDDPGVNSAPFTFGPRTVLARTTDFGADCAVDVLD